MAPISLILGNLCSAAAMVTDSVSASQKTPKKVLEIQLLSQLIYCVGAIILGGYSAAVQNIVSILRNIAAIRNIRKPALEWLLIGAGIALGILFNNHGLLGLLPVIGSAQYSIAIFRCRDTERGLKISFMVSALMFAVFSAVICNYVGIATNTVVAVSALISLLKTKG